MRQSILSIAMLLASVVAADLAHAQQSSIGYVHSGNLPPGLMNYINDRLSAGLDVYSVGLTGNNGWIAVSETGVNGNGKASNSLKLYIDRMERAGTGLASIGFTSNGGWYAVNGQGANKWAGYRPGDMIDFVRDLASNGTPIKSVDFSAAGQWAVVYGAGQVAGPRVPPSLAQALGRLTQNGRSIISIGIGDNGKWIILHSGS